MRNNLEMHRVARVVWLRAGGAGRNDGRLLSTGSLILGVAAASSRPAQYIDDRVAGGLVARRPVDGGRRICLSDFVRPKPSPRPGLGEKRELRRTSRASAASLPPSTPSAGRFARILGVSLAAHGLTRSQPNARDEAGNLEATTAHPAQRPRERPRRPLRSGRRFPALDGGCSRREPAHADVAAASLVFPGGARRRRREGRRREHPQGDCHVAFWAHFAMSSRRASEKSSGRPA